MARIRETIGDIFDSDAEVVVHQVNCMGVMGAGLAKQIKARYPEVFREYKGLCSEHRKNRRALLGCAQLLYCGNDKYIANCFGQLDIGKGLQTDYNALAEALTSLALMAEERGFKKIAIPYGIGCGLAGGSWTVVEAIIRGAFAEYDGAIEICRLNHIEK